MADRITSSQRKEIVEEMKKNGRLLEIKPNGKYLLILPKDAEIKQIAAAISQFFKPTPIFVLAVNDVSEIKIAELIADTGSSSGT